MRSAAEHAGRDPAGVRLVAVTKEVPAGVVALAIQAGLTDLGENYVKEMAAKVRAFPQATWHYVGALQRGTAHRVADLSSVVHSLVPGTACSRLAGRARRDQKVVKALIQVDMTGSRAGIAPEEVPSFAREASSLEGIEVRGLMTLPPMPARPEDSRPYFRRLRELRDEVRESVEGFAELSMGMSADYQVAVEEGATMIRIGTALFGERPSRENS
jgi:pyridoxal phosphate enzyme (YggS family)